MSSPPGTQRPPILHHGREAADEYREADPSPIGVQASQPGAPLISTESHNHERVTEEPGDGDWQKADSDERQPDVPHRGTWRSTSSSCVTHRPSGTTRQR
jgi:hypothetical protein